MNRLNRRTWGSSGQKESVQKAAEASARARRKNRVLPSGLRRPGAAAPSPTPRDPAARPAPGLRRPAANPAAVEAEHEAKLRAIADADPTGLAGALARKQLDAKYGPAKQRTFEQVEAEFRQAVADGDEARINRLADEMEAIEDGAQPTPPTPAKPVAPTPPAPTKAVAPAPAKAAPKPAAPAISDADKVRHAATMYGTGSKQHQEAQRRFGPKPPAKAAPAKAPAKAAPAAVKRPPLKASDVLVGGKVRNAADLPTVDQFSSVEEINAQRDRFPTDDAWRRMRSQAAKNARPNGGPRDNNDTRSKRIAARMDVVKKRLADDDYPNDDARANDKAALANYARMRDDAQKAELGKSKGNDFYSPDRPAKTVTAKDVKTREARNGAKAVKTASGQHYVKNGDKWLSLDGKTRAEFDNDRQAMAAANRVTGDSAWIDSPAPRPRPAASTPSAPADEPAGRQGGSRRGKSLHEQMAPHNPDDAPLMKSGVHVDYNGERMRVMGYNPSTGKVRVDDPGDPKSPTIELPLQPFLAHAEPVSRGPVPNRASDDERDQLIAKPGERLTDAETAAAYDPKPSRAAAPKSSAPRTSTAPAADGAPKRGRGRPKLSAADVEARRDKYETPEKYEAALARARRRENPAAPRAPRPKPAAAPAAPAADGAPKRGRGRPKLSAADVEARRDKYETPEKYEAALARAKAREAGAPVPRTRAKAAPAPASRTLGDAPDVVKRAANGNELARYPDFSKDTPLRIDGQPGIHKVVRATRDPQYVRVFNVENGAEVDVDRSKLKKANLSKTIGGTSSGKSSAADRRKAIAAAVERSKPAPARGGRPDASANDATPEQKRRATAAAMGYKPQPKVSDEEHDAGMAKLRQMLDDENASTRDALDQQIRDRAGTKTELARASDRYRLLNDGKPHPMAVRHSDKSAADGILDTLAWQDTQRRNGINVFAEDKPDTEQMQKNLATFEALVASGGRDLSSFGDEDREKAAKLAPADIVAQARKRITQTKALMKDEERRHAEKVAREQEKVDEAVRKVRVSAKPVGNITAPDAGPQDSWRVKDKRAHLDAREREFRFEQARKREQERNALAGSPVTAEDRRQAKAAGNRLDKGMGNRGQLAEDSALYERVNGQRHPNHVDDYSAAELARDNAGVSPSPARGNADGKPVVDTPEAKQRKAVDALAEIRKGVLGANGRRAIPGERFNSAQAITAPDAEAAMNAELRAVRQRNLPKDAERDALQEVRNRYQDESRSLPIPGTQQVVMRGGDGPDIVYPGDTYGRGQTAPTFAGQIKVGDTIAMRQERQAAYNSRSWRSTTHSKRYEVTEVGSDARGVYYKLSQPGKETKGTSGRKWRPEELDRVHGIVPGTPAPASPAEAKVAAAATPPTPAVRKAEAAAALASTGPAARAADAGITESNPAGSIAELEAALTPDATPTQRIGARIEALEAQLISPSLAGTAREQQNQLDSIRTRIKNLKRDRVQAQRDEQRAREREQQRAITFTPEGRAAQDAFENRNRQIAALEGLRKTVKTTHPDSYAHRDAADKLARYEAQYGVAPGEQLPRLPRPGGDAPAAAPTGPDFDRNPPKYLERGKTVRVQLRGGQVVEGKIMSRSTGQGSIGDVYGVRVPGRGGVGQVDIDVDMNAGPDAHKILPPEKRPRAPKKAPAPAASSQPLAPTETPSADDAPTPPKRGRGRPRNRTLDEIEGEMSAAVEAGDDARVEALADEMDRVEAKQKATDALRATREQARGDAVEARKREQVTQMLDLIDGGMDPDEAEAKVYGLSYEFIQRRDFMRQARADGLTGKGFDELVYWKHQEMAEEAYRAAEDATNGYMLKKGSKLGDPRRLWMVNDSVARANMTDEMAEWFDEHGRVTRPALRQMILDGNTKWRSPIGADYLQ